MKSILNNFSFRIHTQGEIREVDFRNVSINNAGLVFDISAFAEDSILNLNYKYKYNQTKMTKSQICFFNQINDTISNTFKNAIRFK